VSLYGTEWRGRGFRLSALDPHWYNADSDPELFISMRIRIRIQLFITNAEPDPEPGSQTNADPDQDPGQTLKSQKVEFYMKNILNIAKRSKT
jgi:hypothetical protein